MTGVSCVCVRASAWCLVGALTGRQLGYKALWCPEMAHATLSGRLVHWVRIQPGCMDTTDFIYVSDNDLDQNSPMWRTAIILIIILSIMSTLPYRLLSR